MLITIDVAAFYDFVESDKEPTDAQLMALEAKPANDGTWLWRTLIDKPSHTQITLPEAEIADCMAHCARMGKPKSRERMVAWYIEEQTMPHHAHQDHWLKISVHDEPELEAFLNKHFALAGGAK